MRKFLIITLITLIAGIGAAESVKQRQSSRKPAVSKLTALQTADFKIVNQRDDELIVEWTFPDIQLERDFETGEVTGIDMPGAAILMEPGVPRLPMMMQLMDCYPGRVQAQIIEHEAETVELGEMAPTPEDFIIDPRPDSEEVFGDPYLSQLTMRERRAMTEKKQGLWPREAVETGDAGVYRGHRLVALRCYPVQVNTTLGTARVTRRIKIRVQLPRESGTQDRLPDRGYETEQLRNLLGPMATTAKSNRMREAQRAEDASNRALDAVIQPLTGRWKIVTSELEATITKVTYEDLELAEVPVDQITTYDLHLFNRGEEVPVHLAGEGDGSFDELDYLEFYSVPNQQTYQNLNPAMYEDPWTGENVYILSWGDGVRGLRLGEEDASWHYEWPTGDVRPITSVISSYHFEKNTKFARLQEASRGRTSQLQQYGPLSVYDDHWYWGDAIDGLTTRNFQISLPHPTSSFKPVTLRIALQGYTWSSNTVGSENGYHRAIVFLNGLTDRGLSVGQIAGSTSGTPWLDQTTVILQSKPDTTNSGIITNDLFDGINTVSVSLPGDGISGANDKIFVNWIEVEYDRQLRADFHYFKFHFDTTRGDTFSIDVRGFFKPNTGSNISVWKLGHSRLTNFEQRIVQPADELSSWAVRFQIFSDDAYDFLIYDDLRPIPPVAILPEVSTQDLRNQIGARYVMIIHDSFKEDGWADSLLALRAQSFSGSVMMTTIEEVYEQFSYGIPTPDAIRGFIQYAYDHWMIRPTHLCLVGDARYDVRETTEAGHLIPTYYSQTFQFGISSSDVLFSAVSGPPWDIIPDVAVGRISCRSSEELGTYVDKVIQYETEPNFRLTYHSNVLFVSDARDVKFNFDKVFTEPVIQSMVQDVNVSRIYVDSIAAAQIPARLREAFREGAVIVNYNGHGGGGLWSQGVILDVNDVALLGNGEAFPFITNFTCYVGVFDERGASDVLGEAFLFDRDARDDHVGGIGVYSSTGVGWAASGIEMQHHLFNFMPEPPGLTLGEIVQQNKSRYWAAVNFTQPSFDSRFSMMMMMTLLGDPGVHLALPEGKLENIATDTSIVRAGESVLLSGTLPWEPSVRAELYALLYNGVFTYENYDLPFGNRSVTVSRTPAYDPLQITPLRLEEQSFDSLVVDIEPEFIARDGRLVIYAVDELERRDVVASVPLYNRDSLGSVQLFDVEVMPDGVIHADSLFRVRATILHENGIEYVRFRGVYTSSQGIPVLDTVYMHLAEPGLYETSDLGPYETSGATYRAKFFIKPYGEAEIEVDPERSLPTETLPDFSIIDDYSGRPEMYGGGHPYFRVPINIEWLSATARPTEQLTVEVTAVHDSTVIDSSGPSVITLDSVTQRTVYADLLKQSNRLDVLVPLFLKPVSYRVSVFIDPDNEIPETKENNNEFETVLDLPGVYPCSNAFGSFFLRPMQGAVSVPHWTDENPDTLSVRIPPGSLPVDTSTLVFGEPEELSVEEQLRMSQTGLWPDSEFVPIAWPVSLAEETEALAADARIDVEMILRGVPESVIPQISLFVKRKTSSHWRKLDNVTVDTATVSGSLRAHLHGESAELGRFAALRFLDQQGPTISFNVGGMRFTEGSLLPRRPEIYVTASDLNGVDRSPEGFFLILDGDTVPDADISWADTLQWGGQVSAQIIPDLEAGDHTLYAFATDNAGNTSEQQIDFEVRGTFGIEWAINYPNPFRHETTISYVLTDVATDFVEVKIYTVAGRLIRRLHDQAADAANYRSVNWDGCDERGEEVANGVYFARIIAKQRDKEVEETVKLAKVR